MIKRLAVAVVLASVGAGLIAPPAHADPPYCDPTSQDYSAILCQDEPAHNPACWEGDSAQCTKDWRHEATQPAPPGEG
jgi:hypothetical protein